MTSLGSSWADAPGQQDITAHLDLADLRRAAAGAGLQEIGCVDQTYFLMSLGIVGRMVEGGGIDAVRRRLAARTLIMPGGLGSTMKAFAFGKGMNGIEATSAIKARFPDIGVLALSTTGELTAVSGMAKSGASGYVFKGGTPDDLIAAIKDVAAGKRMWPKPE